MLFDKRKDSLYENVIYKTKKVTLKQNILTSVTLRLVLYTSLQNSFPGKTLSLIRHHFTVVYYVHLTMFLAYIDAKYVTGNRQMLRYIN